ncbi:hypothetical protein C8Q78DRAFT_525426 [Trametes maxima]|nr:hypothetical protein C8Q78DRAFT_525426 [Trametes maxima]
MPLHGMPWLLFPSGTACPFPCRPTCSGASCSSSAQAPRSEDPVSPPSLVTASRFLHLSPTSRQAASYTPASTLVCTTFQAPSRSESRPLSLHALFFPLFSLTSTHRPLPYTVRVSLLSPAGPDGFSRGPRTVSIISPSRPSTRTPSR